jgi:hypothetical protein
MTTGRLRWFKPQFGASLMVAAAMLGTTEIAGGQVTQARTTSKDQVTFTKDIAPILQRSCQNCHRPNSMAPMSLLTYQDARPWSRSIKEKVVTETDGCLVESKHHGPTDK